MRGRNDSDSDIVVGYLGFREGKYKLILVTFHENTIPPKYNSMILEFSFGQRKHDGLIAVH